jgi:hypothetical protein
MVSEAPKGGCAGHAHVEGRFVCGGGKAVGFGRKVRQPEEPLALEGKSVSPSEAAGRWGRR